MEKYEHIQKFTVKYCEVDFKDELKLSTMLSFMEEVACSSADELGFGYAFVKPRGYAFMVSNIVCEFLRPIPLGECVQVKTWPSIPSKVIFGREYQLFLENGEKACNASSRWCLVDMQTGKLLPASVIDNQDYSTYNTDKAIENVKWSIPSFGLEEGELRYCMTVANSDYDHNMHVNNTKYADYCMNCFSIEELSKLRLQRFSISYVKQCKEGQALRFYRQQIAQNEYLLQGINEQNEQVIRASVTFAL